MGIVSIEVVVCIFARNRGYRKREVYVCRNLLFYAVALTHGGQRSALHRHALVCAFDQCPRVPVHCELYVLF